VARPAPDSVDLNATPRRSWRVVSRLVAGEHILVPLASRGAEIDSIFNLNPTGTFIWERIDGRKTVREIASLLSHDFQVSAPRAEADCAEFAAQLLEVRAIELSDTP
jgi:Coenzyme PQQ synthesis protein D (PqqD)